ncbi:hypothetical protein EUX98_g4847 [Antrodiella citrinella]|uniref:ATP-dependent DNA helicase PIF1 n=1 Tax=Antrodiella citrinella TaxID=2447956 RepID=A0A4S4MT59_9APHY|nr:hypothetical protein EUX98_g4847 [Antrodiella citrinella]
MARSQTSATSITITKKRKSTGDIDEGRPKQAKQPRKTLDTFFAPQLPVSATPDEETGKIEHVSLNEEQIRVLKMVVDEEKNVFFTGSAGTGKSLLLRAIISALRKKHAKKPEVISVTASTGMAASNIGGVTIHSWGAVTPGMHDIEKLISFVKTCRPAHKRWKDTKVLIIDEVSMVDGKLFDTLAQLADRLRKQTNKPFGGIQLIVTGDFFQLPPVTSGGRSPFFAFQSKSWSKCIDHIVILKQVFRQKDTQFVDLLNEMRRGQISVEGKAIFRGLSRPLTFTDDLLPTELFPLRSEVDKSNAARLTSLPGELQIFEARDTGTAAADKRAKLLENMVAPKDLQLKVDAQVMLIKNVDETLVNGSVGKILGFFAFSAAVASIDPSAAQTVKKEVTPSRSSTPSGKPKSSSQESASSTLKLGSMVRNVCVGEDGRTPVAILETEKENADPEKEDKKPSKGKSAKDEELFPLVEFFTHQGKEIVLVVREEFRVEDNEGKPLARRVQVPLVLAWAMSIHKSQGQTIQRVRIDLGKVFEKGQSYVALSRAASLDGLQVVRFDPTKVQAHAEVVKWSKKIEEEQAALAAVEQKDTTSA